VPVKPWEPSGLSPALNDVEKGCSDFVTIKHDAADQMQHSHS
jgi:hypothetical protein